MNDFIEGSRVVFTEKYSVHTGIFYVGKIDPINYYPYVLVKNIKDIGMSSADLAEKYGTDTRDYDVAEYHQIELYEEKNMNNLIEKVEQWFIDRGLQNADPNKQMLKLFEEIGELASGMARSDTELIVDSIGDTLVVLIGLCMQMDLGIAECLETAYNEIKYRKGKLINGVFVKESDYE